MRSYYLLIVLAILILPTLATGFLKYVVVPWRVRSKQWRTADPQFHEVELEQMPKHVAMAFQSAAVQLARLGFSAVSHVGRNEPELKTESFISIWTHRAGDVAQVIAVCARRPDGTTHASTLTTFRREYTDSSAIITSNTVSPKIFPINPVVDAVVCPHVWDLSRLYEFHTRRVQRDGGRRDFTVPQRGRAAEYLGEEWRRTFQYLAERGYYVFDAASLRYQPTLPGAYVMTWRLLWPLKPMRLAARDRHADRVLRELGFGGLADFRRSQAPPQPMATAATRV